MAFEIPTNAMTIGFQLLGAITLLMQEAPEAFDGKPGSGERKRAWVMKTAEKLMETQNLIKVDLMNPEQEAAVLKAVSAGIEFVFSSVEASKLFQPPTPTTV